MPLPNQILKNWLCDIVTNIRFFTRIPVPKLDSVGEGSNPPDFTRTPRAFPIIGVIVALPVILTIPLQNFTAAPSLFIAAISVLCLCAMSGGIHEDGLADCADGFFGGESPQKRLEIMKDSHIGSFGVIALTFSIFIRIVLVEETLFRADGLVFVLILIAMASMSRAAALWIWPMLPPARPEGLAAKFGIPSIAIVIQANLLALLIFFPLVFVIPPVQLMVALICCAFAVLLVALLAKAKIGGHTGDVIGACQQVAEIGFLVGLLLMDSGFQVGSDIQLNPE